MSSKINILVLITVLLTSCKSKSSQLPIQRQRQNIEGFSGFRGGPNQLNTRRRILFLPDPPPPHHTQCRTIPNDFGLCYGMEYSRMRLPNLLGHETMTEIKQQSSPWPPLVSNGCHPETRKFLCSLYAPVCMKGYEKLIQPCRSLCVAVRDACIPTMKMFGFLWPEMLNCTKFPAAAEVGNLCIPESRLAPALEVRPCPPCRQKKIALNIRKKFCSFDFVMKVRVRQLEFNHGGTRILINRKARKVYKWPKSIPKSKRNSLWMRDGLHCTCNVIKSIKTRYLVTGWKTEEKNLVLNSITKWSRKYRKIVKKLKKAKCVAKS